MAVSQPSAKQRLQRVFEAYDANGDGDLASQTTLQVQSNLKACLFLFLVVLLHDQFSRMRLN